MLYQSKAFREVMDASNCWVTTEKKKKKVGKTWLIWMINIGLNQPETYLRFQDERGKIVIWIKRTHFIMFPILSCFGISDSLIMPMEITSRFLGTPVIPDALRFPSRTHTPTLSCSLEWLHLSFLCFCSHCGYKVTSLDLVGIFTYLLFGLLKLNSKR